MSGIAIDTFLFSRIGMPLFHRYRVFDRFGSHPAFRKPYMPRLFLFLKESDSESIRRSHRRWARELAVGMSPKPSVTRNVVSKTMQSGPAPQRTVLSKLMGPNTGKLLIPPAGDATGSSVISRNGCSREEDTVQALMDLSLPRFTRLDDGRLPKTRLWPITEQPPSSPASVGDGTRTRTPSPCYQLDDLTSASSTGGTLTNDYRLTLLTDSSNSITPVGSIVSFSDDDLPLCSDQEDKRKVQRRDLDDDVLPGPTEVPEYIPMSRQTPVKIPMYTPTPRDRLVSVLSGSIRPVGDNMFDPMLGEWPVDNMSGTEDGTQKKPAGGHSLRPTPTANPYTLVRTPLPREKPSGEKPYGLRPRNRRVEVSKLKGRPVDDGVYDPLHNEQPGDSGAKDEMFEKRPVDNPKPGVRPVGVKTEAPRSEKQPVDDTASERISRNGPVADARIAIGRVPPMTKDVESQKEGCDNQRWRRDGPDDRGRPGHWACDDVGSTRRGGVIRACPATTPTTSAVRGAGLVGRGGDAPDNY